MRQFVHRKPDGTRSDEETLAAVLTAAQNRVVKGDGHFQLTKDREPIGPARTRAEVLTALERNLTIGRPGPVYRVENEEGVVFTCREVAPIIPPSKMRQDFVGFAEWGVAHAAQIGYSQARPVDFNFKALPWTADCSGSTIAYAKAAGMPDPSGSNYSGAGNTDSILRALKEIDRRDMQLGDLVLWANGTDGKHVAILIEKGGDPLMASHGSDAGPIAIRLSAEDAWHSSETMHFLSVV